ncbi:hypothetical protein [Burkholderia stagnalis]|uniref:hypothetical protein n=1 Tax=Burkholderia stagnalis TaxID=1503054 RepID=UPI00075EB6D4|nr:hypothetical protein [Burkholderia stagnalis]KVL93088.1 hypothetical protein WT03_18965 [Burkholderia stagnalis]KVL94785.1 hypothetical protein WT02_18135 [Burkholderia stagnalis]KVM13118.1 hypothetical protein WT04_11455 [Burkholderia stagnalis]
MTNKSDDQQKLISFRVEEGFLKKFEALKERFSVGGKKTSTSELARSLLETASVQHGEFGELLGNEVESIKHIQQLAQTRQPLRRAQWELLSYLVHRAYRDNRRQMVQGTYFKTVLRAFAAWHRLANRIDRDDRYFLSNLRDTGSLDLQQRVAELIASMPTMIWNSQAEFGSRNFNVAMRDGLNEINVLDLNEALMSYLPALLPVAVRAVCMQCGKPLMERERDYLSPPIKPVRTEHYWLSVHASGDSLTAALELSTHRSIHPINSYLQFRELAQLLEEVSPDNLSTHSDTYWLSLATGPGTHCYVRYLGHQMAFTEAEFDELRELFRVALVQPDIQHAIQSMVAIYGDI